MNTTFSMIVYRLSKQACIADNEITLPFTLSLASTLCCLPQPVIIT